MFAALLFGRLVSIYSGMPAHIFVLFWLGLFAAGFQPHLYA
jgi:hypothetical protein